jgi:hypothetical protein
MPVGPIFWLRLFGLFCKCFEKDEDSKARLSLQQLNDLGKSVDWHVGPSRAATLKKNATGFVNKLFGSGGAASHTDTQPPTKATLKVVDAEKDSINYGNPYPELQLVPIQKKNAEQGMLQSMMSYQLDIPLHHIQRIDTVDPTMLVIVTKDVHNVSLSEKEAQESFKEAARISFTSQDDRDAAVLNLRIIVEWNRNRQPDIEEDLPADGIRARAQKAAHFAKREMELRDMKRTREERKAKFVAQGGGLKYTAMAMANQS